MYVYGQVTFKDVRDVQTLAKKLNVLESKVELDQKELISLRSSKYTIDNIVGQSPVTAELKKLAVKASQIHAPVMIMGESGTGKELFAHAIHYASEWRTEPLHPSQLRRHTQRPPRIGALRYEPGPLPEREP